MTSALSKYHAVPTVVNGRRFDSQKEARRYEQLLWLGLAGGLRNLEVQPTFSLVVNGVPIGVYRSDFRYEEACVWPVDGPRLSPWRDVVEDVKGMKTALYRWKAKHLRAQYGIVIRET